MNGTERVDYDAAFSRRVHRIGRLTLCVALVMSFSIPVYLSVVLGHGVDTTVLASGIVFAVSFVGVIWVIEPVSYFPVLGPVGTYMSFLSGNIGNMRMPAVGAVQNALGTEAGSRRAELAAVFGLVASTLTNLAILLVVIVGGAALVSALPASILGAFSYAVPGIIGCMIVTFGSKMGLRHIIISIVIAVAVIQAISLISAAAPGAGRLLTTGQIGIAALFGIAYATWAARREQARTPA